MLLLRWFFTGFALGMAAASFFEEQKRYSEQPDGGFYLPPERQKSITKKAFFMIVSVPNMALKYKLPSFI